MKNILETKNLTKTYTINKKNYEVLKNINLQIKKGEFVSVMGRSGSGKSTLLYTISGMDKSSSGSIIFDGKELSGLAEKELSKIRLDKIGFIFQQFYLLKNLSIFDNIILPAYLGKKVSRSEINKHAFALMKETGVEGLAENDITQASGGQLQRVGICRALINNPEIIYGDEPTGALNSTAAAEVMEILDQLNNSGKTILLVTHDPKIAAKTERVLFMLDGSIVAEKNLGKYIKEKNDLKQREEILANWLIELGF
ncbi:MAG: ABC transporter ATP-binding protein [Candidatus Babeliales bacterium]